MKGVYIVSKGGISKVGSSYRADKRSKKVAVEVFGALDGCEFFILEHEEFREVERLAHKHLAGDLLSNSPVYSSEMFSVSISKAKKAVIKASKLIQPNKDPLLIPTPILGGRVPSDCETDDVNQIKSRLLSVGMLDLFLTMRDLGEINATTIKLMDMIADMKGALDESTQFANYVREFVMESKAKEEAGKRAKNGVH